jgi:hypothetical protein
MVDLTNVSVHDQYERFLELLHRTSAGASEALPTPTTEYAFYRYPQHLITTNSNLPFFVASPKLFALMNNTTAPRQDVAVCDQTVPARLITLNGQALQVVKLGQIAEVNQGISTGQNDYYVRRDVLGEGYKAIDTNLILSPKKINNLSSDEKINGVDPKKYQGRHFIPFDKGGESDADEGWMPNYYVATRYYIDWSKQSLNRMRSLTIKARKVETGELNKIKDGDEYKLAAALRNPDKWFRPTICFSPTGQYSPSFRLGTGTISQNTSSTILLFHEELKIPILGLLSSVLGRYYFKNYHNHTVHTQEGDVFEFNLSLRNISKISTLVSQIIAKQKINPRYDYASHEQVEIDRLVYEAYGLNAEDIAEVETWYQRRYPKLAGAQARNRAAVLAQENLVVSTETEA